MSLLKTIAWIAALAYSVQSYSCDLHGKTGIVEENDLYISVHNKSVGGITESDFNKSIDKVEAVYAEIIEARGATLKIKRKWDNGTVNAYALRADEDGSANEEGVFYEVHMFGGLARHETITKDGFSLVVCHELGHHIGGAPRKHLVNPRTGQPLDELRWASNEGQADYWGTMKCLRKVWEKEDNIAELAKIDFDKSAQEKCESVYTDKNKQAICVRAAMAGKSLASLFRSLRKLPEDVDFTKPVLTEVERTNDKHPAPQCRLDTYFSAALCTVPAIVDVDIDDALVGNCNRVHGYEIGTRPLCWYKPANE